MTMKKGKNIVLEAKKPPVDSSTVALTPEAYAIVARLKRLTGQSVRSLVSEIVLQAEDLIEIRYVDEEAEE